jgi:regulator of nonsense transcripts 2
MTVFKMLKLLFKDFTNHNVELIAAIFETCGRFLYLTPYTHDRLEEALNTMLRLRRQHHVTARHQSLLEVAYFAVKPPERVAKEKKVLTTIQKYARYLILEKLNSSNVNVDNVIKSLRRLPWNIEEENLQFYIVKFVLKSVRTKISSSANIADCLSGLFKFCPNVIITVIDKALAEIGNGYCFSLVLY